MRISNSKLTFGKIIATIFTLIGIGIIAFFGIGVAAFTDLMISEGQDQLVPLILCLLFVSFGFWLVYCGAKRKKLISECKRYVFSLTNCHTISSEKFASVLGVPSWKARKNLNQMISRGYIEGVYLDKESDRIVLLQRDVVSAGGIPEVRPECHTVFRQQETVSVQCHACGGYTAIPAHSIGICDYCGMAIRSD